MTETMIETNDTEKAREMADLRWANDFLCLWRVCGGASCRRARSCRGRAHLCFKRNKDVVPKGARLFFEKLSRRNSSAFPSRSSARTWNARRRPKSFSAGAVPSLSVHNDREVAERPARSSREENYYPANFAN